MVDHLEQKLRVGLAIAPTTREAIDFVREAEKLGVESVWIPEYWGYDAFTPAAAVAVATNTMRIATGIAQLDARTPAMLAMSAMGVQELSQGRFVLGIGTSGPVVMEGWHGVDFARPVSRTRETIEIVRMICAGERLSYSGDVYQIPRPGGLGKPIRSAASPVEIPIYVASLGPKNLHLTGELADGWIGNSFLAETAVTFFSPIAEGAVAGGRNLSDFDFTVAVGLEITHNEEETMAAGRRHADGYAFTFGAMGSSKTNYYLDAFARQGFGPAVREVQRLWLEGDRAGAAGAVPIEIGLGTNLVGTVDDLVARVQNYVDAGVTTLRVSPLGETAADRLDALGTLVDVAGGIKPIPPPQSNS